MAPSLVLGRAIHKHRNADRPLAVQVMFRASSPDDLQGT